MNKIIFFLPILLASCSYQNGSDQSKISTPQPQTITAGISTGNTTESATLSTQSGWLTTTWSKIIFEKNLSPSIRIVQDENNTTAFFRDQKIASISNIIKDDESLSYHSIEKEIVDILKTNEMDPLTFTSEQKKQFGKLYAQKYFFLYETNQFSDETINTASGISVLSHLAYEWPADWWVIDENTNDTLTFTGEIQGIRQIDKKNNAWYILGENAYDNGGPRVYLNIYTSNQNIRQIPLKDFSTESEYVENKQFELIGDTQVKIWYGPSTYGFSKEDYQKAKKDWKSYTIDL